MRTKLYRFDPRLSDLRTAVVTMVAVLASYGAALSVRGAADLHVDVVIQAVALSWTAAWTQRGADLRNLLLTVAVLPPVAVVSVGVAVLMDHRPTIGGAVFVACFALAVWVRRFGPLATRAGTLAVLPLVTSLVVPGPVVAPFADGHTVWVAVIALIVAGCVVVVQLAAARLRLVPPGAPALDPAPPRPAPAPGRRLAVYPSTRLALQMAAALGAALAVGRHAYPDHWAWVVLTAYIVCSGARARTDVLRRGALRTLGAAMGTAVATWVAGDIGAHDNRSVVLVFVILAVATWLRPASYAYWAGCVTAMLSLLLGYFGDSAPGLLQTRLAAIGVGAALGAAASWLILPIPVGAVVRRRAADALGTLAALLAAEPRERGALDARRARFEHGVRQLDEAARPLRLWHRLLRRPPWADPATHRRIAPVRHRRIAALRRSAGPDYVAAADAVRGCLPPAGTIARCATPELRDDPQVAALTSAVVANITAVRRAIGRRPGAGYQPPAAPPPAPPGDDGEARRRVAAAVTDIDDALGRLARIFAPSAQKH